MTTTRSIAFIGAGNMTQSIVGGMVAGGYPADQILVSNPSVGKLEQLAERLNVQTSTDNAKVASAADVIVLAVKPQLMQQVCTDLQATVTGLANKLIVTIAAGVRFEKYHQYLGANVKVVRVMPNTPSLVGAGVSGLVAETSVSQADRDFIEQAFASVGLTQWVQDEDELDILGAVAGSGPAYFFEFMASLQAAAEALGYDRDKARAIVQQTALGAATMAQQSSLELAELRAQVTSKGGSTAKGVEVYLQADIKDISERAVRAAVLRNQEMAKLF